MLVCKTCVCVCRGCVHRTCVQDMCVCVGMFACVRAYACVGVGVCVCVCLSVCLCLCVCVCVSVYFGSSRHLGGSLRLLGWACPPPFTSPAPAPGRPVACCLTSADPDYGRMGRGGQEERQRQGGKGKGRTSEQQRPYYDDCTSSRPAGARPRGGPTGRGKGFQAAPARRRSHLRTRSERHPPSRNGGVRDAVVTTG